MMVNGDLVSIVVREFDAKNDGKEVEEVERRCEVGPNGKLSLYTDLLGDPICRVRNSPAYLMLVNYTNKNFHLYILINYILLMIDYMMVMIRLQKWWCIAEKTKRDQSWG